MRECWRSIWYDTMSSGEEYTRALADEVHKELVAQLQQLQYEYV